MPKAWSPTDSNTILELVKTHKTDLNEEQQKMVLKLASTVDSKLMPTSSVIGSMVAQEAFKACTNKYHPINQWFYFESLMSLPDLVNEEDTNLSNSNNLRYMNQIKAFGNNFQEKLSESRIFIVGSGAIGCEHLKNFSMVGLGNILVTDMDTIEKSNLSRQFLFRSHDIGHMKSDVACNAAKKMNPNINIVSHQNKVSPDTLSIYNEKFFGGLTCVTNALDNVEARIFVDSLCIANKKPLIESGTLGTKCNVQVIVPYQTESYGSSRDPPEKGYAICTIKSFPYEIEHTIQWARESFEEVLANAPSKASKYLKDQTMIKGLSSGELVSTVNDINFVLRNTPSEATNSNKQNSCIQFAYNQFHKQYRDQIMQLVHNYPSDCVTSSNAPFWSGTKKCPTPLTFDLSNDTHTSYVHSLANLWANVFNIDNSMMTLEYVKNVLGTYTPYKFVPNDGVAISANEEEEKKKKEDMENNLDIDGLVSTLPNIGMFIDTLISPQQFEKDDDTNYHIDYITCASNLRAMNYGIVTADKLKTKGIAGKIIPAIATTTALVSGLVTFELYKIIHGYTKIEQFRNWFSNIALPFIGYSEPMPAKTQKQGKLEFTFWDSFVFENNPTLETIVQWYKDKYKLNLDIITYGVMPLVGNFMDKAKIQERLKSTVYDIIRTVKKVQTIESPIILELIFDDDEDEASSAEAPTCKVYDVKPVNKYEKIDMKLEDDNSEEVFDEFSQLSVNDHEIVNTEEVSTH